MANEFDAGFSEQDLGAIRSGLDAVDVSAQRVARTLSRAFTGAVAGGKSLEETLRAVALSFSNVALAAAMKPLQQGLSGALSSLMEGLGGGFAGQGKAPPITAFADGGIVSRPTFFGAGAGLGLMGERGAEAIMPLARGPDGRLGVAANGAQRVTRAPPVHVTINTPDATSFQRSQAQVVGALARAVARGRRAT
jgi:phage-related minor tail protein